VRRIELQLGVEPSHYQANAQGGAGTSAQVSPIVHDGASTDSGETHEREAIRL
jgi:hypothetical protein